MLEDTPTRRYRRVARPKRVIDLRDRSSQDVDSAEALFGHRPLFGDSQQHAAAEILAQDRVPTASVPTIGMARPEPTVLLDRHDAARSAALNSVDTPPRPQRTVLVPLPGAAPTPPAVPSPPHPSPPALPSLPEAPTRVFHDRCATRCRFVALADRVAPLPVPLPALPAPPPRPQAGMPSSLLCLLSALAAAVIVAGGMAGWFFGR